MGSADGLKVSPVGNEGGKVLMVWFEVPSIPWCCFLKCCGSVSSSFSSSYISRGKSHFLAVRVCYLEDR